MSYIESNEEVKFPAQRYDLSTDVENQRTKFRTFRREWIPSLKVIIATSADVFGDWIFYIRTGDVEGLDEFENPLWFFCVVSSVLGAFTLMSIIIDKFAYCIRNTSKYKAMCLSWMKTLLGLEIFLEDIPQLVLTVMVLNAKNGGKWSPVAVFNATTSGFNFIFSLLDMMMPLEEEHIQKQKKYDNENTTTTNKNVNPHRQTKSRGLKIGTDAQLNHSIDESKHSRGFTFGFRKQMKIIPLTTKTEYTFEDKMLESGSVELNSYEQEVVRFNSTSSSDDSYLLI